MIPDTTWAWLAALIDGEGSIMLVRNTLSRKTHPKGHTTYRPRLSVYNTKIALLNAIVDKVGSGRVYLHTRKNSNGEARVPVYEWRANSSEMASILTGIKPWLIIKTEQADLMLEVLRLKASRVPAKGVFVSYDVHAAGKAELERLASRFNELGKRGLN